MKKIENIIYASLVFLLSLIFLKALFPALLISLLFLGATIFFEKVYGFLASQSFPSFVKAATKFVVPTILALGFYSLTYLPLELMITDYWMKLVKIPSILSLFFLLFLVGLLNSVSWEPWLAKKRTRLYLAVFITFCGVVYAQYRSEKLAKQYLPKIYRISPDWGVQASLVRIEGLNFFPAWRQGKIILGDQEMDVKYWSDKLILAEQKVPSEFGPTHLYVLRVDNFLSNGVDYEIRNPDELINQGGVEGV